MKYHELLEYYIEQQLCIPEVEDALKLAEEIGADIEAKDCLVDLNIKRRALLTLMAPHKEFFLLEVGSSWGAIEEMTTYMQEIKDAKGGTDNG